MLGTEAGNSDHAGGELAGVGHGVEPLAEALHLDTARQHLDQAARVVPGLEVEALEDQILSVDPGTRAKHQGSDH